MKAGFRYWHKASTFGGVGKLNISLAPLCASGNYFAGPENIQD